MNGRPNRASNEMAISLRNADIEALPSLVTQISGSAHLIRTRGCGNLPHPPRDTALVLVDQNRAVRHPNNDLRLPVSALICVIQMLAPCNRRS